MLTDLGLVVFAKSILGRPYMYGNNGHLITEAFIQQKAKQYSNRYTPAHIEELRKHIGEIGYDCSSIADVYTGHDFSANGWLDMCQLVGGLTEDETKGITWGDRNTYPDVPGVLVFYDGHTGIGIGNGQVIEARGTWYGVVQTAFKDRGWKQWGYCPYISYEGTADTMDICTRGDKNAKVGSLQSGLTRLGIKMVNDKGVTVGIDNEFGSGTHNGLEIFQKANGLPIDGDHFTIEGGAKMIDLLILLPAFNEAAQAQLDAAKTELKTLAAHAKADAVILAKY